MSLVSWWREMLGESQPVPPEVLSQSEVEERVRAYAAAHSHLVPEQVNMQLERQPVDDNDPKQGHRWVYVVALGRNRPIPFVDVDAKSGTILAWRSLSR